MDVGRRLLFVSGPCWVAGPRTRRDVCVMARRGASGKGKAKGKKNAAKPQPSVAKSVAKPVAAENKSLSETPVTLPAEVDPLLTVEDELGEVDDDVPRMKLPDLPTGARGVRRRKRKQAAASAETVAAKKVDDGSEPLASNEIERLTQGYRSGKDLELLRRIEVEPDYMFKSGQAEGEYELASAIIGTGRPNEQGLFVTPYLQSAHLVLLGVLLLGTFVYYPGFPLTEGSDELRARVKLALAAVYTVNMGLAAYAYGEAKARAQPPMFWAGKVALLGNIALQELRQNAPLKKEKEKGRGKGRRGKKKSK